MVFSDMSLIVNLFHLTPPYPTSKNTFPGRYTKQLIKSGSTTDGSRSGSYSA